MINKYLELALKLNQIIKNRDYTHLLSKKIKITKKFRVRYIEFTVSNLDTI